MTIAISALCQWQKEGDPDDPLSIVVIACDQMLTAGDIEFEPPHPKIYPLTTSIVMLIAGNTAALSEIHNAARIDIDLRLQRDQSWMWVQEAANLVSAQIVTQHRLATQRSVLEPLGLTFETFIERQQSLRPELYQQVMSDMASLRPNIDVVVAGVDLSGAHVYSIDRFGVIRCHDAAGFSCIGSGGRLASAQFMTAKHTRWNNFPETQLLAYIAKRRAETAPGVGAATDLAAVMGLGGFTWVHPDLQKGFGAIFEAMEQSFKSIADNAYGSVRQSFEQELNRRAAAPEPPTTDQPAPAVPTTPSASPSPAGSVSSSVSLSPSLSPSPSPDAGEQGDEPADEEHR